MDLDRVDDEGSIYGSKVIIGGGYGTVSEADENGKYTATCDIYMKVANEANPGYDEETLGSLRKPNEVVLTAGFMGFDSNSDETPVVSTSVVANGLDLAVDYDQTWDDNELTDDSATYLMNTGLIACALIINALL